MIEYLAFKFPGGRIDPVAGMPSGGNETLQSVIRGGLTWLLIIVTLASVIFFILGGIGWITSQGDKGKIEAARKRIMFAVIGLIVAFASYMIINTVGQFFGVNPLGIVIAGPRCSERNPYGKCPSGKICTYSNTAPHFSCK